MLKSFRFNPGFQTDEQSVARFVVRRNELESVLHSLSATNFRQQHILIIAQRGAGKSTLCRRVLAEVRRQPELSSKWTPVFLGEESYSSTTPAEFLLECLYHLANDTGRSEIVAAHAAASHIQNDSQLFSHCLTTLRAFTEASGKRLLLFVENVHMILNDQMGRDSGAFSELLAHEPIFGVLATSVQSDDEQEHADDLPGFNIIKLNPLELDECHDLWKSLTGNDVDHSRVRPLQILTGGSPRLIQILAEFSTSRSLRYIMENLNWLIDQNTEYFKSQLDALPGQERKVFVSLLEAWDPASAKQIAESARVTVNTASALLNRLTERGAVIKQPGSGRSALYYAAERLFNIYYLMRRRSHPSNRVRALVSFMTQYYAPDELVASTADLALEACSVEPSGRADYHNAFDAILKGQPDSIRAEILRRTPQDFLASLRKDPAVRNHIPQQPTSGAEDRFRETLSNGRAAIDDGRYSEGRELLNDAMGIQPENYEPWLSLAFLELREGANTAAIRAAKTSVEKAEDNPVTHTVLGLTLNANDEHPAASESFRRALELDPRIQLALTELAKNHHQVGEDDEALDLLKQAAPLGKLPDEDMARYGQLLYDSGEYEEAELVLREAVSADLAYVISGRVLAQLLANTDRVSEGADILRQTAEKSLESGAWVSYASYLSIVQDDPNAANAAVQRALTIGVRSPSLYQIWAEATLRTSGNLGELSEIAERAVAELDSKPHTHIVAGQIYEYAGQPAVAEEQYRTATGLSGADEYPWLLLGRMLSKIPSRTDEAEEAFKHAVALENPRVGCAALKDLAELRVHRGDDAGAVELLDTAIQRNDDCICSLILRAEIAARNGMRGTAIEHLEKALELNSENVAALTALARISPAPEAERLIEQAFEAAPDDPRALLARSRLTSRDLPSRIKDAHDAVVDAPEFAEAKLELAALSVEQGDWEFALGQLDSALDAIPSQMEIIPSFVDSALKLVKAGHVKEVEAVLKGERGAYVEPLLIALRLHRGENPVVAKEVEDVAKDILRQLVDM